MIGCPSKNSVEQLVLCPEINWTPVAALFDHRRSCTMTRMTETRTAAETKAGFSSWDGDTYVVEMYRHFCGHQLTIVERIHVEGQHLIYKHEITGPGDKHDEFVAFSGLLYVDF